jgi:hypothetical protein
MNKYLLLIILTSNYLLATTVVRVPESIEKRWKDTGELQAVCAQNYYEKVAAIKAGLTPIGYTTNTKKVSNKRSMDLLSTQKYHFIMMDQHELRNATGEQKTIELESPAIRNTTLSLDLPSALRSSTGHQRAECSVIILQHPSKKK